MSKPIKLTEKLKAQALEEFAKVLNNAKMADGKFSYNKNFTYKGDAKATICFTPLAYTKMLGLIMNFDTEVAWHGVGKRIDKSKFLISDILVYPQQVSGSTVEMDTENYAKWLMENDEDERFDNIIMQGHSHVNFDTTPSPTDIKHQEDILSQLTDDMFYIFIIWNKKLEHTSRIYDLQNNILYEDKDISYEIDSESFDFEEFLSSAKKSVKIKPSPKAKTTNYQYSYLPCETKTKVSGNTIYDEDLYGYHSL